MFQSIPWLVLRPILSNQAPSIQAFTESVFLYAIATRRLQVVRDLLQHKSIKATVILNGSALISAVRTSSYELVGLILDVGACPNKTSYPSQNVPLTEAMNVHVAQLLVKAGADINAKGGRIRIYDISALVPAVVAATVCRNTDLVRYLIKEGADVNLHADNDYSAAMLAVDGAIIEILLMLLQAGARPNDVSKTRFKNEPTSRMTPLQKAAAIGDIEAVRLLVKYGGDVNAPAHQKSGMTALQAAVSHGDIKMTKELLENGADVNVPGKSDTKFPCSLLTTAIEINRLDLVKVILDAGANVTIPSFGFYGCTALESAIHMPYGSDIRNLLVARGAQKNTQSNTEYRQVQLRKAVLAGDFARVKVLLRTGLKIVIHPLEESSSQTFYHLRPREQKSILQHAIISGSAIFNLLFNIIRNYEEDIDFHPLLVEATRAKNIEIQITLLEAGANINSTHCRAGKLIGTPLMFAVQKNDLKTVRFLYDKGADVNIVVEDFYLLDHENASTALQISLWNAQFRNYSFDVFHFLRHHGATINAPISREYGLSELALAVKAGNLAIVQELLNAGANVNSLPAEISGKTALQAAANLYSANIDIIRLLLQRDADVNASPARQFGMTALGAAAALGHFQVALILLKSGADVNAEFNTYEQTTSLQTAVRNGRLDMVYLLLKAGADLHLPKEMQYVRAIKAAREGGHIAIATILENWKVDDVLEHALGTTISQTERECVEIELE